MSNLECIDDYNDGTCRGDVSYFDVSASGQAYPRCTRHRNEAINRDQAIRERYPVFAPADFDPDYAGERWDDDY